MYWLIDHLNRVCNYMVSIQSAVLVMEIEVSPGKWVMLSNGAFQWPPSIET